MVEAAEEWRSHPKYGDLVQASSLGRVRQFSFDDADWKSLKPRAHQSGYMMVNLNAPLLVAGVKVHRLVAECFYGPRPPGMVVAHKNSVRTDNRPENLMWATHEANKLHMRWNGTAKCPVVAALRGCAGILKGRRFNELQKKNAAFAASLPRPCGHMSCRPAAAIGRAAYMVRNRVRQRSRGKIDEASAGAIRALRQAGVAGEVLARAYGISHETVRKIVRGVDWRGVQPLAQVGGKFFVHPLSANLPDDPAEWIGCSIDRSLFVRMSGDRCVLYEARKVRPRGRPGRNSAPGKVTQIDRYELVPLPMSAPDPRYVVELTREQILDPEASWTPRGWAFGSLPNRHFETRRGLRPDPGFSAP